jgi:hypothetical protein
MDDLRDCFPQRRGPKTACEAVVFDKFRLAKLWHVAHQVAAGTYNYGLCHRHGTVYAAPPEEAYIVDGAQDGWLLEEFLTAVEWCMHN